MGFAVDEALDELYRARPEDFTGLRTRLAAAAKKSGDTDAAKRITGSRKPTTAAWAVNALALTTAARAQLADLGSRLREAHAAMDGEAIRALTAEQRKLVDALTRTALTQAGVSSPSAALRDDVTSTLQAAVADPDVTDRLGRLAKAEQWSGFGDFGVSAAKQASAVAPTTRSPRPDRAAEGSGAKTPGAKTPSAKTTTDRAPSKKVDERAQKARAALAAAERAKSDADAALTELQSDLATARLRHQDAQRRLAAAQEALAAAEDSYAAGKQASRDAADAVKAAKRAVRG
ncbi:hypothetical protein FHR72_000718 [Mycolicibacterium iranicum]|uniref:Uncharacterized protein n=1 Tax=Mycolicibacterium iranicum TaxID=912594 RepID=A0A839Q9I2_MYCIR|nr:hypothetical protein [Mycolicibacterium iranicum]MBB2989261.1 hypothetical protein [Mycolicibacterium iranicum]